MSKATKDATFVQEAARLLGNAWTADRQNREDAQQDLKFLSGDQWPTNIRLDREANNRPCLVINQLPQFVNQVVNDMRKNPRDIKFIPADGAASDEIAEVYTGLMRHIQNQSGAASVYAHAGYYAVACGIGHFRVETGYIDDNAFEQEIKISRIHYPLSVYWDPKSIEPDRSDADFCFVTEQIQEDDFKKRWPDASRDDVEVPTDAGSQEGLLWRTRDYILVGEYWYKVPVKRVLGKDAAGRIADITDVKRSDYQALQIVQTREVPTFKVMRVLINGSEILEEPTEWAGRYIPIFPVVGSEVARDTLIYRHGLIRFARDPQQLFNFWRSSAAESIALAPKSPYIATPGMIGPFKGQWDTMNTKQRPYLLYEPDPDAPGARPMREAPADIPSALVNEVNMAASDIKATIGIYEPQLGMKSNEISGRAILARDEQGDVGSYHYHDNLTITLRHLGKVMCDLIPKIYDSERTLRILGQNEKEKFIPINKTAIGPTGQPVVLNDMTVGKYDVQIKVGPSYGTKRQEAADGMLAFVQAVPQAASVMGDMIAKTQDWPDADVLAARLKALLPQPVAGLNVDEDGKVIPPPPPTPEQIAQQSEAMAMQRAAAVAEVNEKVGKARKISAEALQAEANAIEAKADAMYAELVTAEKHFQMSLGLGRALVDGIPIAQASTPADLGSAAGGLQSPQDLAPPMQPPPPPAGPMGANGAPMASGPVGGADAGNTPLAFAAGHPNAPLVLKTSPTSPVTEAGPHV